jgi:hypothetical protein
MKSWSEVQAYINKHGLEYRVERYNMSLRGTLVGLVSKQAVAYTVKDAAHLLSAEVAPTPGTQAVVLSNETFGRQSVTIRRSR